MEKAIAPLVTIIIPVYNIENYLEACIQSVINQNYRQLEIIIVNDGSTDSSRLIIDKFLKLDERIICIDKHNEGLAFARRTGILQANGKYIQHLDGDDALIDGAIEKLVCKAEETGADIVVAPFLFCYPDNKLVPSKLPNFKETSGLAYLKQMLDLSSYWSVWSHFQRRSLFLNHNIETFKDISIGEDVIMMTQLLLSADKIASLEVPTIYYNKHLSSMSFKIDKVKYKSLRHCLQKVEQYIFDKGTSEDFKEPLAYMHYQMTYASLHWGYFEYIFQDMKRLQTELKEFPELQNHLAKGERKLLHAYKKSPYLGYIKSRYYKLKGKI